MVYREKFFIRSGEQINNMLLGSENDLQLGIEQNCVQLVQQNVAVGGGGTEECGGKERVADGGGL